MVQPGQQLHVDLDDASYAGLAGLVIAQESSMRAERFARATVPSSTVIADGITAGDLGVLNAAFDRRDDWKSAALSGVSAGVTLGLDSLHVASQIAAATGSEFVGAAAQAAIGNVATQGIGMAIGVQDRFDWRGVAASAVGAGVGSAVGDAMGLNAPSFHNQTFGAQFGARLVTGLTAGAATAVMRGGKVAVLQIASDAFGNALGSSLASATSGDLTRDPSSAVYENEMDRQSDAAYATIRAGEAWARDVAARRLGNNPFGLPTYSAGTSQPQFASQDTANFYGRLVGAMQENASTPRVMSDEGVVLAAAGALGGGITQLGASGMNYRNGMDIANDLYRPPAGGPGRTMPMPAVDINGNPTGGTMNVPVPANVLLPGENVKGNVFFGGAGMDGAYIKDMVRAFEKQGIALTPANRDAYSNSTLPDATVGVQITRFGQLPYVPLLDNVPQVGGRQFNLLGYSYGSNVAAQVAVTYARGGTAVDNLVLIGSPIGDDYLKTLRAEPNIRNVVVVNLTDKGGPIRAGMSNASLIGSAPTLGKQMLQSEGHFYYAPDTPAAQVRRDALAEYLYRRGLR